jgi:hypothetical protein
MTFGTTESRSQILRGVVLTSMTVTALAGCRVGRDPSDASRSWPTKYEYQLPAPEANQVSNFLWSPRAALSGSYESDKRVIPFQYYTTNISVSNISEFEAALQSTLQPMTITVMSPMIIDRPIRVQSDVLIRANSSMTISFVGNGSLELGGIAGSPNVTCQWQNNQTSTKTLSKLASSVRFEARTYQPRIISYVPVQVVFAQNSIMGELDTQLAAGSLLALENQSLILKSTSRLKDIRVVALNSQLKFSDEMIDQDIIMIRSRYTDAKSGGLWQPAGSRWPCVDSDYVVLNSGLEYDDSSLDSQRAHKLFQKSEDACRRGDWTRVSEKFLTCGSGR